MPISQINSNSLASGVPASSNMPVGSVLQVVSGSTSTAVSNSTSVYIDTGITATITPKFATSKIVVLISIQGLYKSSANYYNRIGLALYRNASLMDLSLANLWTVSTVEARQSSVYNYVDSPASTSALTYKLMFCNEQNVADVRVQKDSNSGTSSIILMEIAA